MSKDVYLNSPKSIVYSVLPSFLIENQKNRAIGPDLSHWKVSYDPEGAPNKADFAITKATEGLTFVDPALDLIWNGISKLSIRGLFHYQRSGMSWRAQADHFLNQSSRFDVHILALDVESVNNQFNDSFFQDSYRILQYLKERSLSKIMLYTNPNIFQNYLFPNWVRFFGKSGEIEALEIPLWIAQYWLVRSPDKDPGMPKQRTDWNLWQWTDKADPSLWGAGSLSLDLNVFNGSVEAMKNWLNIPVIDPTPEPPPIEPTPNEEPQTEEDTWKANVVASIRVHARSYPKVDETTVTGHYVLPGQSFLGKIWPGNGYLWIKIISTDQSINGKWSAVRSLDGLTKLIRLEQASPAEPGTPTIPSPGLGSFWRVKHDIELPRGNWRPGMPEVHPLFVAPKDTSGDHFSPFQRWAQYLSRVANPAMSDEDWSRIYWYNYWISNYNGFGMFTDLRANYILGLNLSRPLPKVESLTCGGSLLEGFKVNDQWVKVKGLHYNTPVSLEFLMSHPQFQTRGVYPGRTGTPFRMLGNTFSGGALIHPLIVNENYDLYIQAYKLQEWTSSETPDPLKLYSKL